MLGKIASDLLLIIVGVVSVNGNLQDDLRQCPTFLPRTQLVKSYNDKCLYLITGKQSWTNAKSNCQHHGGRLVQIQDQDKQDFIYNTLKSMHWGDWGVWIGATDHDSEGTWKWTDGTKLSYGHWHPGEGPSHNGFLFSKAGYEDCALMRLDDRGRWHDYDCGTALYHHTSVCEYKKVELPTTTILPTTTMPTTMSTTAMATTAVPSTTTTPPTTTNTPTTMTTTVQTSTKTMPTTRTTIQTTATTTKQTTTTMPTTTITLPTTTTTTPATMTTTISITTTLPTTTTTPTTKTTTMPTTTMPTTTMPTTTTLPITTTTTLPTTTTTKMATATPRAIPSSTVQRKETGIPDVTITKSSTEIEIGTTSQGTDRRANVDNTYDALVDRQDDKGGSSTGIYIAIGASSGGVVVLVAAILALVLRRRKRQLTTEANNRTTNTRENPVYDIMHGDGGVPENSFA